MDGATRSLPVYPNQRGDSLLGEPTHDKQGESTHMRLAAPRWHDVSRFPQGGRYIVIPAGLPGRENHVQPRVMGAHARLMRLFFLWASACMQAKQGSKMFSAPARKKQKCQHFPGLGYFTTPTREFKVQKVTSKF